MKNIYIWLTADGEDAFLFGIGEDEQGIREQILNLSPQLAGHPLFKVAPICCAKPEDVSMIPDKAVTTITHAINNQKIKWI